MSIKRTIIAAVVGLTLVAMVAPGVAQGVTIEELLAQIAQLQVQLAQLQAQSGGGTVTGGTVPAACAGVTFTRALVIGSTGTDVKCAQALMNANGYTVATTGAGSPGNETSYFGSLTLAAVQKFQAAKGWTPASQVGPLTRQAFNALLAGGTTGGTTGGTVVPTGSGLTVQKAFDNPASGSVVAGQSLAPMLKLTFANGDNAAVTVTQFKVNRTGVSGDTDLTNVYLFNGATRLTDGASVSSGVISFNDSTGLFTVPAFGSVTITVAADIYASAAAGTTVGVQMTSSADVTSNASSTNGVFPIAGNLMTVVATPATFGTVSFTSSSLAPATSYTSSSPASIDPQDDYAVWRENVQVNNHAAKLTRIAFREIGSINYTDLQNFRLYIDGVMVGSAVQNLDSKGYVTFDMTSSPVTLQTGSREIKVLANVVGGSNRNFTFSLRQAADVTFVESQYNVNMLAKVDNGTFSAQTTGYSSINSGTLTITKATDSPSSDVVNQASSVTLGKFTLKAAGEAVKVETLDVAVVCTDAQADVTNLRNGALYANGVQVGSTTALKCTDYSTGYTQYNLGSSLIVQPGSPVTLEVKADIYDNTVGFTSGSVGLQANDTLQARIVADTGNGQGQTSLQTVNIPSTTVNANSLTVSTGGLSLSKYPAYTNQSVVAPVTNQKIGHFTLTANTTEAVNINTIQVNPNAVVSSYGSNLYVKYGNNTSNIKSSISASNSWYVNYQLPAGQTIDVEVFADMNSSSSGTAYVSVYVAGTTASSATSTTAGTASAYTEGTSGVQGQAVAFTDGALTEDFVGTPQNQLVAGSQQVEVGRYKITSSYDKYTVKEMRFTVGSATIAQAIVSASLKDGSTVLATVPYDATYGFRFTGLNVEIPASSTKTLTLSYLLSIPSATAGSSDVDVKPTLTYVKQQAYSTGTVTEDTTFTTAAANSTYVYKSIPTLTQVDLSNTGLIVNGGEQDLYSFKVTAGTQGDISVKQFKIDVTWSDTDEDDTLKLHTLKLLKDGVDITDSVSIVDEDLGLDAEGTSGVSEGNGKIIVVWDGDTEDNISAGDHTTYLLKGTPAGFGTLDDSVGANDSFALTLTRDTVKTATHDYLNIGTTLTNIMKLYLEADANASASNHNFIWSDESAVAHSASTTASTNDWTNSYLLQSVLGSEAYKKN